MIHSIRTAITDLTKKLAVNLVKPFPKTSSCLDEQRLSTDKKLAIQPMPVTSLKLDKAVIEQNQSWCESISVNQNHYKGPEPASTNEIPNAP